MGCRCEGLISRLLAIIYIMSALRYTTLALRVNKDAFGSMVNFFQKSGLIRFVL